MADDIQLNAGTGGALIHTDDLGGSPPVHVQRMKIGHGVEGSYADATPDAPLPVELFDLVKKAWRCGFDRVYASPGVDPDYLTIVAAGSGMAISQAGGSLVITTGTTINAETIIRSVESFTGDMVLRYSAALSQRIANQHFTVELVDVIGDALAFTINSAASVTVTFPSVNPFTSANVGQSMRLGAFGGGAPANCVPERYAIASVAGLTVTFTVAGFPASGSGTLSLYAWNACYTLYSGTTATAAVWDCQRNGWASGTTSLTINTTASTHVGTTKLSSGEASYQDQTGASSTTIELARRASRVRNVPNPDTILRFQIRVHNLTSAPASTTTFTIGVADISACDPMAVSIADVQPMSANSAMPVEVVQTITQPVTLATAPAQVASTALIGDVGQQYRANATGAASRTHIVSAASTNAANAKASAGRVLGWSFTNTNAAYRYVKLHNSAGTPTAGASVFMTIAVPPNGRAEFQLEGGIGFSTGIAYSIVTGSADADATAVGAGDVVGDLFWA